MNNTCKTCKEKINGVSGYCDTCWNKMKEHNKRIVDEANSVYRPRIMESPRFKEFLEKHKR